MRPTKDRNQCCNYNGEGPPLVLYRRDQQAVLPCFPGDWGVLNGIGKKFMAYNLMRNGIILTRDQLREYLRILISMFLRIIHFFSLKNSHFRTTFFRLSVWNIKFPCSRVLA